MNGTNRDRPPTQTGTLPAVTMAPAPDPPRLSPGQRLFRALVSIRIWQKLIIICLAFAAPTVPLLWFFVRAMRDDIDLARRQACGAAYAERTGQLIDATVRLRVRNAGAGANADRAAISALAAGVDSAEKRLEQIENARCADAPLGP